MTDKLREEKAADEILMFLNHLNFLVEDWEMYEQEDKHIVNETLKKCLIAFAKQEAEPLVEVLAGIVKMPEPSVPGVADHLLGHAKDGAAYALTAWRKKYGEGKL